MRRYLLVLTGLLCLTSYTASAGDKIQLFDEGLKGRMETLLSNKKHHLADMATRLSACLNQRDSRRGMFAGCGSRLRAIQAVWGVMSYGWLSRDMRYVTQIRQRLSASSLRREWRLLQQGKEVYSAYEKSWFLRLALDHMRIYDSKDLVTMADWMAQSLIDELNSKGIDPGLSGPQDQAWLLLAVHGYAAERNPAWFNWVYDGLRDNFSDNSTPCAFAVDGKPGAGELSKCAMRMVAGHRVNETELFRIWVDGLVPGVDSLTVVNKPASDESLSVNFVRAAAFWRAFATLKQEKWAKLYLDHVEHALNYDLRKTNNNSNHVAAFGILALAPLWYINDNGPA